MEKIIISIIISSLITFIMYLDSVAANYNRTKAYFVKLFIFSFIICFGVNYFIRKGNLIKRSKLIGGGEVMTGLPTF
tara:strand:+ start:242 stop:472 length:231 start_codon:yes stop_codon:yes gene_type:complete